MGALDGGQSERLKRTTAAMPKNSSQEARALLEKSKAKGEDSATVYSELGAVYYRLERVGEGRRNIHRSVAHAAAAQRFALFSGRSPMRQLGRIKEAEQKYREILAFSPDDAEALKALQDLGQAILARSASIRLTQRPPVTRPGAFCYLACAGL